MKTTYLFFALTMLFTLNSCSNEEIMDQKILIQSDETYIEAIESEDFITIHVESLIDLTDNQETSLVSPDYCNISFDINSNKEIDSEIDFGYESPTKNYDICSYYFLDNESITHCAGHPTTAIFSESFSSSSINSIPHRIWELKISKEELDYTKNLSFTVKTIDRGFFRAYPTNIENTNPILFYFNKTLTFKW